MKSALAHFQTVPLKDAARQLHHAFQEIEINPFILHPSSFILFNMLGITLSNDQLPDKRFDFQFANPPYGSEWSKDYAAVTLAGFVPANGSMSSNQSGEGDIFRENRCFSRN